jgi:hypothetical protein
MLSFMIKCKFYNFLIYILVIEFFWKFSMLQLLTYIWLIMHVCTIWRNMQYMWGCQKYMINFKKCFARIAIDLDKMHNTSLYIFTHPKIKSFSNGHISRTWTLLRAHGVRFSHGGFTSQSFSLPSSQITKWNWPHWKWKHQPDTSMKKGEKKVSE